MYVCVSVRGHFPVPGVKGEAGVRWGEGRMGGQVCAAEVRKVRSVWQWQGQL